MTSQLNNLNELIVGERSMLDKTTTFVIKLNFCLYFSRISLNVITQLNLGRVMNSGSLLLSTLNSGNT